MRLEEAGRSTYYWYDGNGNKVGETAIAKQKEHAVSIKKLILLLTTLCISETVTAEANYYYVWKEGNGTIHNSPQDFCNTRLTVWNNNSSNIPYKLSRVEIWENLGGTFHTKCWQIRLDTSEFGEAHAWTDPDLQLYGRTCPSGLVLNITTGTCSNDQQKGPPEPLSCIGNPIDILTANKYQYEEDYSSHNGLYFSRSYNSLDKLWRGSHYTKLRSVSEKYYSVVLENGKEEFFTKNGVEYKSTRKYSGTLTESASAWRYKSMSGEQYKFNKNGEIVEKIDRENRRIIFTKKPEWIEARDDFGRVLKIKEDKAGQPLTVEAPGLSIQYTYKEGMLLSVSKYRNEAATETRSYHYEDLNNAKLLTGITDERGIRYATWTYDNQGRAISSEHANGAEKVSLAYNDDGSTTVTNEYGKQATYRFQVIQGIKRIVAIEGEPSPNCPSSNSTFTYDDQGLLTSKRDNNGNLTT
ncbi:TPA: hypothetical protein ACGPPG_005999, partial [Pseudomonas aeruginosa]